MTASKDLINSLNTKSDYENFSEEVEILSVTNTGNMAIYTVKNKNGVTFRTVPGLVGLDSRGYMGFVNGDRSRPIMISGLSRSEVSVSAVVVEGIPVVDITASSGCAAEFSSEIAGLTVTFQVANPGTCDEDGYLWDFGDGQYETDLTDAPNEIVHTYQRTGTYDVKVWAFERDAVNDENGGPLTSEIPNDNGKTNGSSTDGSLAVAYADLNDNIWEHFGGAEPTYGASYVDIPFVFEVWSCFRQRDRFKVPLSAIASNTAVVEQRCFIYVFGKALSYTAYNPDGAMYPVPDTFSGSNMGMSMYENPSPSFTTIGSLIDPTISMVDSIATIADSSGTEPPTIPDDPKDWYVGPDTVFSGWVGIRTDSVNGLGDLQVLAYKAGTKREMSDTIILA